MQVIYIAGFTKGGTHIPTFRSVDRFTFVYVVGYAEGGTQIQPFRSAGLMNFAFNNNVTLVHNTYIYVTAIATNTAGLKGVSYSDPILVDLTPPDIKYVNDGAGKYMYVTVKAANLAGLRGVFFFIQYL